jgi:predicted SprT family Zn-dependent metalloprotease
MNLTETQALAEKLISDNNLDNWRFKFDNSLRRFGCTKFKTMTISLSQNLTSLNEVDAVKDCILHEIAHALAGVNHGHDNTWRTIAYSIGCNGQRLYDSNEVIAPPRKWQGTCPNCHRITERHRRLALACSRCCRAYNGGRFTSEYLFIWSINQEGSI